MMPVRLRQTGFSMVEIMVGIVISLISTLIVMQVFSTFEAQKRTTTSGSDAQTNGGLGLYTMERDMRMAGYGLGDAVGCQMQWAFNGGTQPPLTLAPVRISRASGWATDSITVVSSNKQSFSLPARVLSNHAQAATEFTTDAPFAMAPNDLVAAYENIGGTPTCTLFQVNNAAPVLSPLVHASGNWNGNTSIFPANYSTNAYLLNLGSLTLRTYALDANSNLVVTDFDSSSNTYNSQILSTDVVSLQAEYGFDTRPGAQGDAEVDTWSNAMLDADSSGTTGDAGDYQRIYAVRFVIVARSGVKEKAQGGACNVTTASPAWNGATAIDLSKNPDGSANADWQCYRYKTFETVVPLRNRVWVPK